MPIPDLLYSAVRCAGRGARTPTRASKKNIQTKNKTNPQLFHPLGQAFQAMAVEGP
jgi:hypothetical protein